MLKKTISTSVAAIRTNCGTCLHFKRTPLFGGKPCVEHGVLKFAYAPSCYKPDVHSLIDKTNPDLFPLLGRHLAKLDPEKALALAHILSQAAETFRLTGFRFGQPVFFTLGGEYLTHFFRGYVLSAIDDGYLNITSTLHDAPSPTLVTLPVESVLTKRAWAEKISQLVAADRIKASPPPSARKKQWVVDILTYQGTVDIPKSAVDDGYTPPTIDTAPDSLLERARGEHERQNKRRKPPTVRGFPLADRVSETKQPKGERYQDEDTGGTLELRTETGYQEETESE